MITFLENLLSNDELFFLDSICSEFFESESHSIINNNNYYVRKILNVKTNLFDYQEKCKNLINDIYEIHGMWINKVTTKTNLDDKFHFDDDPLTIITYINDDFDGGSFEYIDNKEKIKIQPIRNCSLIVDNTIKHRVTRVTNGERYSLVSFYTKTQKKEKSLI
jgi:predicted 2-oxoglutarate/Fe(II)-dependent dioxygenase YbiX